MRGEIFLKADTTVRSAMPSLREFTWLVFRDVNRTLGGIASMELMRRTCGAKGWLTEQGHAVLMAVSRLTPGTTVLAYSVALGWQFNAWRGALLALVAASVPASLIIAVLSATLVEVDRYPVVRAIIAVALVVATWLVLATAWNLLRPYLKGANTIRTAVLAAVVIGLVMARITPIRILLVAAAVGVVMGVPSVPPVPKADR
jgi:chromate transporter